MANRQSCNSNRYKISTLDAAFAPRKSQTTKSRIISHGSSAAKYIRNLRHSSRRASRSHGIPCAAHRARRSSRSARNDLDGKTSARCPRTPRTRSRSHAERYARANRSAETSDANSRANSQQPAEISGSAAAHHAHVAPKFRARNAAGSCASRRFPTQSFPLPNAHPNYRLPAVFPRPRSTILRILRIHSMAYEKA
jgi:hypothetical protein